MNIIREEIRTGLLVVFSLVVLVGVLLYLGSPGVFVPMKTYWIYTENGAGIKPGADVLLAGRRIGQLRRLYSPVPEDSRPDKEKKLETLLEVRVERSAEIYTDVRVYLTQNGLLGEMLLDFSSGSENVGVAPSGAYFIATRPPGISDAIPKVLEELHPALEEATRTLQMLQKTADGINALTGPTGEVQQAVAEFHKFGINLNDLTGPSSSLRHTLANVDALTGPEGSLGKSMKNLNELTGPDGSLAKTLKNAEHVTENKDIEATLRNLRTGTEKLDQTMKELNEKFSNISVNLEQATDTLKRQPWRLIWPSTKAYPEAAAAPVAAPAATPTPKTNKRRRGAT